MILAFLAVLPGVSHGAATVNYSGNVYLGGAPVVNGFVIAGTFAPSFDPLDYKCTYGSDDVCNMDNNGFVQAVSDGVIFPIGSGTNTDITGAFSGTGVTDAAIGAQIFLFAFGDPLPDIAQNIAFVSSSDPAFLVPADGGTTALAANQANFFLLGGYADSNGLHLSEGLPMPEPGALALTGFCIAAALISRVRVKLSR